MSVKKLRIDIWSDIACPWCYVGKRRLEAALAKFSHAAEVDIVWRAFELDPTAPPESDRTKSYAERLAAKYGRSVAQAEEMITNMTEVAKSDALDFHFERVRSGNTFDAHRVIHFAAEHGVQGAVKERLLKAYMTDGEPIGDREALVRLGAEAGLDANEVRTMLASDACVKEVRADEAEAKKLGIRGVPFFVLGGRYAVSGAQPTELMLRALEQAWTELATKAQAMMVSDGAACGADGRGCD